MIVIKRIGLGSAFKIGALIGFISATILGLLIGISQFSLTTLFAGLADVSSTSTLSYQQNQSAFIATSLAMLCIFYAVYIVMATIGGGLSGLFWAWTFNIAARWAGGLELEIDSNSIGKSKRSAYAYDDIYE